MKTKKNFLKKLAAVTLGFVMTLGVGAAGYASASSEVRGDTGSLTIRPDDFSMLVSNYGTQADDTAVGTEGFAFTSENVCKKGKTENVFQFKKNAGILYNTECPTGYTIVSISLSSESGGTLNVYKGSSQNPSTAVTKSNGVYPINGNYFGIGKPSSAGYAVITINYSFSSGPTKLDTPTGLSGSQVSGTTSANLTWSAVTGASSYEVKVDGTNTYTATTNSKTVENLTAGSHSFTVKAIGDETIYSNSDVSSSSSFTITEPRELVSISVSGTPTKTTYYVGDNFDPAGLVVTGTYDKGDPEPITEGIEWVCEPETFTSASQTSVEVLASYGDFTSDPYPVNGLTVQERPKEFIASFFTDLSTSSVAIDSDAKIKSDYNYTIDENITFSNLVKCYPQLNSSFKFGSGSAIGSFTASVPSTVGGKNIHITSVKINMRAHGTDSSVISVAGVNQTLTDSYADYTVDLSKQNVTSFDVTATFASNCRYHISKITITYDYPKALSSISVSNNHRSFDLDTTFVPETVTATYSDGSFSEVTPTSITSPDMSELGDQTISVSYTDSYGSASTSYTINVHYATVTSVTVSPDTYSLGVSGTLDLTTIDVTILPENADQSTFGWTIDPNSKNPSTMDCSLSGTTFSAGNVPGTVDLICTAGDESDKLTVTISAGALISLDKTEVEGIANISSDVEVNATLYNYQSVTSITWTSNDEDVASVSGTSAKGTIKFLHEGSATVTCTAVVVNLLGVSETVSETVSVTVTKQLSSISASLINSTKTYPENTNVPASDLSVTATYSDGQNAAASGFTVTEPLVSMSDNSIKVSYTEGGITVTTDVTVTVVKATLKSLSFTNKTLDQFKQGDATHGTFSLGSNAAITAIYNTSFANESVVVNGLKQSPLKGVLRFELCSRSGTSSYTYTKVTDIELGDPMLRSYNGLYLLAYYKYGESEVRAEAALVTVAAPDIQVAVSEETQAGYSLVTNISQLKAGDQIVITGHNNSVGLLAYESGNNCKSTGVTKSSDSLSLTNVGSAAILTLSDAGDGKFYLYDGAKYLYAASNSSNQLKGKTDTDSTNGTWRFAYSNGCMSIVAEGSSNRNVMACNYNGGSPLFACYGGIGSYDTLDVYKYSSGGSHDVYYTISADLYDAIAALPSPLASNWDELDSLSSFVASGKENTDDYKVLTKGKANASGNMAEQFLAEYDSVCGPQEKTNYLSPRATLDPEYSIAYGNVTGATLSGGTDAGTYTKNTTIELPTASKTGYENATWWTLDGSSTGIWGTQVTESFSLVKNTTIFAKWTPIEYTINYELDGGTNHADNPSTYTIEDKITLKAPTKAGCDFSAWSNGGVIEKGSTGDKTFTASWNPLPQTITFTGSHVTSSGASTCLLGAQYNATFTAEENYNLPGSITVKLNGEDYSDYSYSSVDGSFSIASMPAGTISISVTAQEGSTYTISYAEVDGTPIIEDGLVYEYEFGTGATLVDAQDRLGFNFAGWYNEPELQNKVESIGATEKGHRKFYAKWEFGAQDALNNVKSSIGMSFTYQKDANAPIVSSSTVTNKVETKAAPTGYHFEKATSIAAGDQVVIVSETAGMEMTGISTTSTKYGLGAEYTSTLNGTYLLTVCAGSETGSYAFKNGDKYLRWNSGNSLDDAGTSVAKNTSWTVTFSNGNALLVNANDSAREIWWNSSSPRFACYTGKTADNTYKTTQLYKLVEDKKVVTSIEIVGTPSKTTYNVGEAYSAAGLSVKATYESGSPEIVTATITPNKQYAEAGDTSVTFSASYEGKTAPGFPVNVTVNSVYSNVSFKFNFKNTGMDALVSEYGDVYDDMGLVVEYGGRTRYFSFISDDEGNYYIYEDGKPATTFKMKDGGMFTLNLGDMINDKNDRASIVFTVKAYIRVGETYYYSSNSESYSVKSWIEYYHSQSKYKDATEDLYNIFFPNGK